MSNTLTLKLRQQELILNDRGYRKWCVNESTRKIATNQVAMVLCDVWDRHWCRGAEERLVKLLPRMNAVVKAARQQGVLVVHAPSDTMDFYKHTPARLRTQDVPRIDTPSDLEISDPPLPIDASDGGGDTVDNIAGVDKQVWTRQHPAIDIDHAVDYITDDGCELYSLLVRFDVQQILLFGVHTNMCILNRSFAIKQMVRWEQSIALVRDLTDTMYNPASSPYVDHEVGTQLVIGYIEKHWCPTLCSTDILPL